MASSENRATEDMQGVIIRWAEEFGTAGKKR
jgi:hypothetical protein